MDFYSTVMGKHFFDKQLPDLIRALTRIANNLELHPAPLSFECTVSDGNIFSQLFLGAWDAQCELRALAQPDYAEKTKASANFSQQLRDALSPDLIELFEQHSATALAVTALEREQAFALGCSLATRFILTGLMAGQPDGFTPSHAQQQPET